MRNQQEIILDKQFWNNLESIKGAIGINDSVIAHEMGLSIQKYVFHSSNQLMVPIVSVNRLAAGLGLRIDSFWDKSIGDHGMVENFKRFFESTLAENYRSGLGSKSFTVRHILATAKKYNLLDEVYKRFSLSGLAFESKVNFEIPVQLASDILDFIASKVILSSEDYQRMSLGNATFFENTPFGTKLSSCKSPLEVYEETIQAIPMVEVNWKYKITSFKDQCVVVNSYASEEMQDYYRSKKYASINFSKFRASMMSHLPRYLGLEGAKTSITRSIHEGDSFCQFKIDCSDLRPLSA